MAIARVQGVAKSAANSGNATYNATSNFTQGNKVFFIITAFVGTTTLTTSEIFSSVTIGGVLARLDYASHGANPGVTGDQVFVWSADVVNGNRSDVVVVGAATYFTGAIIEVSGLNPGGPTNSAEAAGNDASPTATVASYLNANSFLLAAWSNGTDSTTTASYPGGYTQEYNADGGVGEGGGGASLIVSSVASRTATFGTAAAGAKQWNCILLVYSAFTGPVITQNPSDQSALVGDTATFTASATATSGSVSYQWQLNGGDIPGATSATYTTPSLLTGNSGQFYRCVVTDSSGTNYTTYARLTVLSTTNLFLDRAGATPFDFALGASPADPSTFDVYAARGGATRVDLYLPPVTQAPVFSDVNLFFGSGTVQ